MHRATLWMVLALLAVLVQSTPSVAAQEREPAEGGGYLGVFLGGAAPARNAHDVAGEDASLAPGVSVLGIVEGGPAERSGLRARDRILAVEGTPVASTGELMSRVKELAPGSWVSITIERRGEPYDVRVRLDERPARSNRLRMVQGWIGAKAIDLPPSLREHFGAPEDVGVMISEVGESSPAESAGLELGDVVYEIDGEPVRSAREFERRIASGGVGNTVEVVLARDGAEIVLEASIERQPEPDPGGER